jgi:hypothetical protein
MPMPGFAGESSLRKVCNDYNHGSPAIPKRLTAGSIELAGCIRGCICVTQEGCPCCANLLDFLGKGPREFQRTLV